MSDVDVTSEDRPAVEGRPEGGPAGALAGARHVLILRLDNAGDVILAGPTIRALRASLPSARLTLLASPNGAVAAELLPWLDDVVPWRAVWQDAAGEMPFDPAREAAMIERLRSLDADAAIILTSFSQTPFPAAYACYLAGIPIRVGHAPHFGGSVLSHPVEGRPPEHQAERDLYLLGGIGVAVEDRHLEARVPRPAHGSALRLLAEVGIRPGDPIVIVPGASCSARRYRPNGFGQAAAGLRSETGRAVVILGTAQERSLARPILAAVPDATNLVGETSVVEAAAIVKAAALVLTNNSLAMHLADAFQRPVVVTYAGTDRESEWAPRDTRHVLLRAPTGCAPCRLFECPFDGHPCLAIDPGMILEAGVGLLESEASGHVERPDRLEPGLRQRRDAGSVEPIGDDERFGEAPDIPADSLTEAAAREDPDRGATGSLGDAQRALTTIDVAGIDDGAQSRREE